MTPVRMRILTAALLVVAVAQPAWAQYGVRFERFGVSDGLSNPFIRGLLQDQRGFLWISTEFGLNRFDGYDFEVYEREPTDRTSLSGAWIHGMYEDHRGVLWLALFVDGVTRFDPATGKAQHLTHDPADPLSISPGRVMSLFEDQRGRMWIATRDGVLNLYERESSTFRRYRVCDDSAAHGVDAPCKIALITQGPGETMWVATLGHGLLRLDLETGTTERWTNGRPPERPSLPLADYEDDPLAITAATLSPSGVVWLGTPSGDVWRLDPVSGQTFRLTEADRRPLHTDDEPRKCWGPIHVIVESKRQPGLLWLGSQCNGLARFDVCTGDWVEYAHDASDENQYFRQSLGSPHVRAIHEDRMGTLWIGTRRGLFSLDPRSQLFRWHRSNPANPFSMAAYSVTAIFEDRSGVLWFGTGGGGLAKFNPMQHNFRHDYFSQRSLGIWDGLTVRSIAQDEDGIFWIGTNGVGVHRYDRVAQAVERFQYDADDENTISANRVNAVVLSKHQRNVLWVATVRGFDRLDIDTRKFTRLVPGFTSPIQDLRVQCIVEDRDGLVWLGTASSGIWCYDPDRNTFKAVSCDSPDSTGTAGCDIKSGLLTSNGDLWFGAAPSGLHRYVADEGRFIHFMRDTQDDRLANAPQTVITMHEDPAGVLWIGTYSGGLLRYDPVDDAFRQFTSAVGLPSNHIVGILQDEHDQLWLSSNRGLSRFDPVSGDLTNYDVSDGLQANEFTWNCTWESADGELFFGGIDGITSFRPDSIVTNDLPPPVVLTSLEIRDREGHARHVPVLDPPDRITLEPGDGFFGFQYAALDFSSPGKNRYQHKLEGLDDTWTAPSNRRYGSYSSVPPGRYTLRVRGSNNDGIWNEAGVALSIVVLPPFWRTAWFFALCSVVVVLAVVAIHIARLNAQKTRLQELEAVRRNESERVRKDVARDIHDELGHLVSRIALFSEIARRQVQAIHKDASLRLGRVNGFARSLAEGMGDFVWMLDPEERSLSDVLLRLKDFGDELYSGSRIRFEAQEQEPPYSNVRLDPAWTRHLTMLFKEAMHNALKHAACRHVELRTAMSDRVLTISLHDDGRGFSRVGDNGSGLRNLESRARTIGGRVIVDTTPGAGTTVTFLGTLPEQGGRS